MDGPAKRCRSVRLDNCIESARRERALTYIVPKKLLAYRAKEKEEVITKYGREERPLIGRVEVQR